MDLHRDLKFALERVWHRQSSLARNRLSAACWVSGALLAFLWFQLAGNHGKVALAGLVTIWVSALLVLFFPVRRKAHAPKNWRSLACVVEARYPELDGRLLTAVQLTPDDLAARGFLQHRLLGEVIAHSVRNDWPEAIPAPRLWWARLAQGAALLLFLFASTGIRMNGGRSLMAGLLNWGVSVSPGDVALERGSALVVLARFGHTLPAKVDLVLGDSTRTRIPMVKSLADPMFGGSLTEVSSNFLYHVEYAGQKSPDYRVTVFEYPRLERADADLKFPAYTKLAAKHVEDTHRISGVEGTQVKLSFRFNKPIAAARLVPRDSHAQPITLTLEATQSLAHIERFVLETNHTYDLQLTDAEGRTNKNPVQFVFQALKNRTPELKLTSPPGDLRPSPLEEITFNGTVWDDFGVEAYGIGYAAAGAEPKFVELGRAVPGGQKKSFNYLLSLEHLGAQPDQLISWFAWADDTGPDGKLRRTMGDLFFGEVRSLDEVFRESPGGQEAGGGGGGGGGGGESQRLTEIQKQIMSATWNLRRTFAPSSAPSNAVPQGTEYRRRLSLAPLPVFGQLAPSTEPRGSAPRAAPRLPSFDGTNTASYAQGEKVITDAQLQALEEALQASQQSRDARSTAVWKTVLSNMRQAIQQLEKATNSPSDLANALAAEQSAYQALLKVQEHEFQVSRTRNQQGQGGRSQSMQRELEQMDLTQSENRYETQRQAQPAQARGTEQAQVINRLQEMARRQQDLNERLKELQTALQEARTEQERAEIQRRLKRLQEEEQQVLADADELRQRMDRPENQSQMSQQRQQLDQTREDIRRAAEAAGQGAASQALASGSRAERQMQDMREQLRKQNSSQFADDLRDMRAQARELANQQESIQQKLDPSGSHPGLGDSPERQQALQQLEQQKQRMTNLVEHASRISEQAEEIEPAVSRELYDSVRKFAQDTSKSAQDIQDQLVDKGMMTRNLYKEFSDKSQSDGVKLLDTTAEMLRLDLSQPATETSKRIGSAFENLRRGVEKAAASAVGDDTEALKLARQQLNQLTEQLQREMSEAQTNAFPTNLARAGAAGGESAQRGSRPGQRGNQSADSAQPGQAGANSETAQAEGQDQPGQQGERGSQNSQGRAQGQGQGQSQAQSEGQGQGQGTQASDAPSSELAGEGQQANGGQGASRARNGTRSGQNGRRAGGALDNGGAGGMENNGGAGGGWVNDGGAGGAWRNFLNDGAWRDDAPLTGQGFVPWSDALRNTEDLIEIPDLRNEVAAARERARVLRQAIKRDHKKPDWAVVQLEVMKPLAEVQKRLDEELSRRESRESLVPIDRDPVPNRYSELVRRYYERLGTDR